MGPDLRTCLKLPVTATSREPSALTLDHSTVSRPRPTSRPIYPIFTGTCEIVLHGIPAREDVAMRFVIRALVAMALVAGFGPGAAWSAKDDGKRGFKLENLLGAGDTEYYTLQPFVVSIVRDGRVARHVSLLITLETRGLANKDKILEARKRLQHSFFRDLHGVMSVRRKDGKSFKTSVLKKRLMAVSKRVLGEDIVRDILIEVALERRFR